MPIFYPNLKPSFSLKRLWEWAAGGVRGLSGAPCRARCTPGATELFARVLQAPRPSQKPIFNAVWIAKNCSSRVFSLHI